MKPSSLVWPFQPDGITNTIYDFGNGYGALHTHGTVEVPWSEGETRRVEKNDLHPLELPRFRDPFINYQISPEVPVTTKTLQGELAKMKARTDA